MKFVLLAACLVAAVAADAGTDSALWKQFKLQHKKAYSKLEEVHRFNVFQQNLRKIEQHNKLYEAGETTYTLGINQFADLTSKEFSQFLRSFSKRTFNITIPRIKFVSIEGLEVPASMDWREKNVVTPVKDQGVCMGGWAFATAGALEAAYALKNNKLIPFSEQQMIDCAGENYGLAGCYVDNRISNAYQYMHDHGMQTESDYPFEEKNGDCRYNISKVVPGSKVSYYVEVTQNDENALLQAVANVAPVGVEINGEGIQLYNAGIFDDTKCFSVYGADHGMLIVGYGSKNGVDYWIVKNSWGTRFGEGGYIRMKRGYNICNILDQPAFPRV